jgi:hypothetical protein
VVIAGWLSAAVVPVMRAAVVHAVAVDVRLE